MNTFLFSAITPKMKDRTPRVPTIRDICRTVTAITRCFSKITKKNRKIKRNLLFSLFRMPRRKFKKKSDRNSWNDSIWFKIFNRNYCQNQTRAWSGELRKITCRDDKGIGERIRRKNWFYGNLKQGYREYRGFLRCLWWFQIRDSWNKISAKSVW